MAEEFYNTFYNAFTSETITEATTVTKTVSNVISESLKYDSVYGNHQRPPKLMNIEDCHWWSTRFENWVKAYAYESWILLTFGYEKPVNDKNELRTNKQFSKIDKYNHSNELKMVTLLQQFVREDILFLLQHGETSKSMWEALKLKVEGGKDIKKNKISLLKREFELFDFMKGDTVRKMIERFFHLKIELERFGINKDREEIIDKLIEVLPHVEDWKTFVIVLKNDAKFDESTLDGLIEKLQSHDLELQKQNKMANSRYQQNVDLYYRRSMLLKNQSPKLGTTFSTDNAGESSKRKSPSYDSGYHSSSTSSKSSSSQNWKDSLNLNLNTDFARQHMCFLASVLESYEGLIAGRIGNPNMTKEDYDHCKQNGHFKRECSNNKADDSVNPFHEDYYKKAIYHRNNEQPSRTNQKQIEEGSSKERKQACVTIQDDEGFNWRNPAVDPEKVDFEALVVAIPTVGVWIKGLEEIPNYRQKVEEGVKKVIYASVEKKKKTVEEIVGESQKMVDEVKKTDVKAKEVVAEKHQVIEEDKNQKAKEATVPETKKEYDGMKLSYHTVKEAYENLKSKVRSLDDRLSACQKTTKFLEARYEGK
ncbi:uncharacterized protein LOC110888942 [Helianthus annuus]|uniref:uncharacterized protein LOC110888942 n=1 Tax=Helianthus annuus TaxID=4232 RepID=UPI000B8F1EDA|nr:uncharacterized protein LOC110888942 [Helianthus annuus]